LAEHKLSAIPRKTKYTPPPSATSKEGAGNATNNSSSSSSSNTTSSSSSDTTAGVVVNNPTRWCERCNCNHPLDKEGFKKCPEFKVGMPYEDEPGYYEREDYDQQLSGI
jgi:hypothetical protein